MVAKINYSTLKIPIKQIIRDYPLTQVNKTKNLTNIKVIDSAVDKVNELTKHVYQFLRLYILHQYETNQKIIHVDKDLVGLVFRIFYVKNNKGRRLGKYKQQTFDKLTKFNEDVYRIFNNDLIQINALNLSHTIDECITEIVTSINNNIKINFLSYVKRFVNSSFKNINNIEIEKLKKKGLTSKEIVEEKKRLKNELYLLKQDIIDKTLESDSKYHDWLNIHRDNIVPKDCKIAYQLDVKNNPQKYLKNMIYMCKQMEMMKVKQFQFFPLSKSNVPCYIHLTSTAIAELFLESKYGKTISDNKYEIWSEIFNLQHKIFKDRGNYTFDYRISTDGYSAALQFIPKNLVEPKNKKNEAMRVGRIKKFEINKNLTEDEIQINRENVKKDKEQKLEKELTEINKVYKNMSNEERNEKNKKKQKKELEFPYIDKLNQEQKNMLETRPLVYVDPGKKNLLYMYGIGIEKDKINKKGKVIKKNGPRFFRYSNSRRLKETKRLVYQKRIENFKKGTKIAKNEELLSKIWTSNINKSTDINEILKNKECLKKICSKTCDVKNFKKYIDIKEIIGTLSKDDYKNPIFRKYKWYSYINKKRSEDKLLNEIERIYGKDIILIMGDFGETQQMKNFISTPGIGLKRKLATRFTVFSIDEFRTSKLNHKTEEVNENLYLKSHDKNNKTGDLYEQHSILTYKMENQRIGCINRDKNAVLNMKKITEYQIENGNRPQRYRRGFDLEKVPKTKSGKKKKTATKERALTTDHKVVK